MFFSKELIIGFLILIVNLTEVICKLSCSQYGTDAGYSFFDQPGGNRTINCRTTYVSESIVLVSGCPEDFLMNVTYLFNGIKATIKMPKAQGVLLQLSEEQTPIYNLTVFGEGIYAGNYGSSATKKPLKLFPKVIPKFKNTWRMKLRKHRKTEKQSYVSIMNTRTIVIHNIKFENYKNCDDALFYIGVDKHISMEKSKAIPDNTGSLEPLDDFNLKTLTVEIPRENFLDPTSPRDLTLCDLEFISIFCSSINFTYGSLSLLEHNHLTEKYIPPDFIFEKYALGESVEPEIPSDTISTDSRPRYAAKEYDFNFSTSSGNTLLVCYTTVLILLTFGICWNNGLNYF